MSPSGTLKIACLFPFFFSTFSTIIIFTYVLYPTLPLGGKPIPSGNPNFYFQLSISFPKHFPSNHQRPFSTLASTLSWIFLVLFSIPHFLLRCLSSLLLTPLEARFHSGISRKCLNILAY